MTWLVIGLLAGLVIAVGVLLAVLIEAVGGMRPR